MPKEYTPPSFSEQEDTSDISLPSHVAGSGILDLLVETVRAYAQRAAFENTLKAYAKDWAHFARWCRRKGPDPLPSSPEMIGLYLAHLAAPTGKASALLASTIDRRLSGLAWHFQQRGFVLDRKNRHVATVLAGIKRRHTPPPKQKDAILRDDILAMVATLGFDLRGLRDRSIILIGYAGGLRRSEIVDLDHGKDDTPKTVGRIGLMEAGARSKSAGIIRPDLPLPRAEAMAALCEDRLRLFSGKAWAPDLPVPPR